MARPARARRRTGTAIGGREREGHGATDARTKSGGQLLVEPLRVTETAETYDVFATIAGGGVGTPTPGLSHRILFTDKDVKITVTA